VVPVLLIGSLLFASCGFGSTALTTTSLAATTTTRLQTQNLAVTPSVRQSLLSAAASYHQLPTTDYVGLDKGTVFYAYDPTTKRYYAAAGLDPSPNSLSAQVGTQDDGGYNLFVRVAGVAKWTVFNDGLGGALDSTCPLSIPATVLAVWGWKAHSCFPPQ
jgi:hypothetical protein